MVNHDCRPGDVINMRCTLAKETGGRINARVTDTFPKGVHLIFNDESTGFWYYHELRYLGAYYVTKCEPVGRPESFGP